MSHAELIEGRLIAWRLPIAALQNGVSVHRVGWRPFPGSSFLDLVRPVKGIVENNEKIKINEEKVY